MKDQINVINNNRQNGVKVEDGAKIKYIKIIDNMGYFYIVDEYKNLINKIKFGMSMEICISQILTIKKLVYQ